jgi:hypothetical protein
MNYEQNGSARCLLCTQPGLVTADRPMEQWGFQPAESIKVQNRSVIVCIWPNIQAGFGFHVVCIPKWAA